MSSKSKSKPMPDLQVPSAEPDLDYLMSLMQNGEVDYDGEVLKGKKLSESSMGLYQMFIQWLQAKDAREYDSVNSQVERLMSAGMSRTQALLTATAGTSQLPTNPDLASASAATRQRELDSIRTSGEMIGNSLSAASSSLDAYMQGYSNRYVMVGDELVRPIGEEIYSWLPRGIQVPREARQSAEAFKSWCLSADAPQEARDLIRSKEWSKMASRPEGWTAFQKYFNANYSTRGYHEDEADAMRMRKLQKLQLVSSTMDNMLREPSVIESQMLKMVYDMQGVTLDMSTVNNDSDFWNSDAYSAYVRDGFDETGYNPYRLLNDDGSITENAPDILQAVADEFNERLQSAKYMSSPDGILSSLEDMRKERQYRLVLDQIDILIRGYEKQLLNNQVQNSNFNQGNVTLGQDIYSSLPEWLRSLISFRNCMRSVLNPAGSGVPVGLNAETVSAVGETAVKSTAIKTAGKVALKALSHLP